MSDFSSEDMYCVKRHRILPDELSDFGIKIVKNKVELLELGLKEYNRMIEKSTVGHILCSKTRLILVST